MGRVLVGSLLAGPEPQRVKEKQSLDQDGNLIPAAIGGPDDPAVVPCAHQMWQWCQARGLNIRDLAMQFALKCAGCRQWHNPRRTRQPPGISRGICQRHDRGTRSGVAGL